MKKSLYFVLLLTVMLVCSAIFMVSYAADLTDDSGVWSYTEVDGGVAVTAYNGDEVDVYVPNKIEVDGDELAVVKVGDGAFKDNTAINSVTLAYGISEIGASAFEGATGMVCILLTEDVTTIGDYAFSGCSSFNSVILYDTLESIGESAFAGCENLTIYCNTDTVGQQYADDNNIEWEELNETVEPEIYIVDGITYHIMNGEAIAIASDSSLTEAVIPAVVEGYPVVELRATFKYSKLKSITLPEGLRRIGENAFYECNSLSDIIIPDSVTNIESGAFFYCEALTSIALPEGITHIGTSAFFACENLIEVKLPTNLISLGMQAFSYCRKLPQIDIPKTVTSIGSDAFKGCTSFTSFTIPDGITYINSNTFSGCTSLTSITIPDSVTKIDLWAFYNCDSLTNILIPQNVTTIGSEAFAECNSLITAVIPQATTKIESDSFSDSTILLVIENSYAHEYAETNEYFYHFYKEGQTLDIITDSGITYCVLNNEAIALNADATLTEAVIPTEIEGYPVTELRATFENNKNLTSVSLPEGLKLIGDRTFSYCEALTNITIPDTVVEIGENVFVYSGITSIVIPENVTTIGDYAFWCCRDLQSLYMSDSVTKLGNYAFDNCYKLDNIRLSTNLKEISAGAFRTCIALTDVKIPNGVESIAIQAFGNCDSLESISIPDSVSQIGSHAFAGCDALTDLTIPNSVTTLGESAFAGCDFLESVKIPSSVTTMYTSTFSNTVILIVDENSYSHTLAENNDLLYCLAGFVPEVYTVSGIRYFIKNNEAIAIFADKSLTKADIPESIEGYPVTELRKTFENCVDLVEVTLPLGLRIIGDKAFYSCNSLEAVDIPESVTTIGDYAFYSCHGLLTILIPDNVTNIGDNAFNFCKNLYDVKLPNTLKTIPEGMFDSCASLTTITLPDTITSIERYAFEGCSKLTNIVIPEGVTKIQNGTFNKCYSLKEIVVPDGMITLGSMTFWDCRSLRTIYVPASVTSIASNTFVENTILLVEENSYAHTFAKENNYLYFVLNKTANPEISYGLGISGTVSYADGTPAADASVEIHHNDGTVKETVTTDENGEYSFTYAEVGSYTIRAVDSSGSSASETVTVKRMNVFDVFVTGETDIKLKSAWSIDGTVVPAGDATVSLTDTDGNLIDSVDTTDGAFILENIPNGTYIIKAQNDNGSVSRELTVFNSNVTVELVISSETEIPLEIFATITGDVEIEDRDYSHRKRNWIDVTLYNSDGIAVATAKTDENGGYSFTGIPFDEYAIVATVSEMRPHREHGYDKSFKLTGYAYVDVTEAVEYTVDTIVLYEENDKEATVSGKVTAQGENNTCEVILADVFRHEVARHKTGKNGKYTFVNVRDGLYFITATTKKDGMGFAVVMVINGNVYGDTDIKISKKQDIYDRENEMNDIPECKSRSDAHRYKDDIMRHKRFYDGLSSKEKKQFSKDYIERLNKLIEYLADCTYESNEGELHRGGMIVSESDIADENTTVTFRLNVEKKDRHEISDEGIKTGDDYIEQTITDTADDKTLAQYYDITLTKDVDGKEYKIEDVARDTDTTGKLRITIEIPEEHRGHKHYSFIHEHNGEPVTLVDLDNDPNTITVEIDRFSTFALAYSDIAVTEGEVYYGDVNGDGYITPVDGVILSRYTAEWGGYGAEAVNADNANVDGSDNGVTPIDSAILARYLASWDGYTELPY